LQILPGLIPPREERLKELSRDLVNAAYQRGNFVLSSGVTSRYFFDKYLFETKPGILRRVATFLAEMIPPGVDRLAGAESGAIALVTAVALETGLPFVIVKSEIRNPPTSRLVEGELYPGEQAVVIEDVVTTGSQAVRVARQLGRAGAGVKLVLAVIDREEGAAQTITAAGFPMRALFRREDLGLMSDQGG
jgi:orotate phosphoribosyltransferase